MSSGSRRRRGAAAVRTVGCCLLAFLFALGPAWSARADESADSLPALQSFDGALVLDDVTQTYPADGEALVTIAGRVLDRAGQWYLGPLDVTLTTDLGTFAGADASSIRPGFHVVAREGKFSAVLRAPATSGRAIVTARVAGALARVAVVFETALHSMTAGSLDIHLGANRSNFYAPLEQFLTDDTRSSYQAALFAQGPVGHSQLTAAIDSAYPLNGDCSGLTPIYGSTHDLTPPSCRPQYPIYGDASDATHLANSSDNVFLRLEHNANFIEWGDYDTTEFSGLGQTYAATTRNLHGAKANLTAGKLSLTALFATNVQAFGRDIIAPDGTSGSYYLSRRLIVPGSENVTLELEPLDRPGTIVAVQPLTAGVDYSLDPTTGALVFRAPITQTQNDPTTGAILVAHIAVTYQYDGGGTANAYGGRLQYAMGGDVNRPAAIGASYCAQNMGVAEFVLVSGDAAFDTGRFGRFTTEVARSRSADATSSTVGGTAFRAQESVETNRLRAQAFVSHSDPGFVNTAASTSFIAGQTRYGADITGKLGAHTTVSADANLEHDAGTAPAVLTDPSDYLDPAANLTGRPVDARLRTLSATVQQTLGVAKLDLGVDANGYADAIDPTLDTNNTQGVLRATAPLGPRWSALGEFDRTLGGASTVLYPARAALGLAYKVSDGVTLGATAQALDDGTSGTRHFTSLDAYLSPKIDAGTELTAKYSLIDGLNGISAQQELGLNHHLLVSKHVRGDIGFEHADGSLFNLTGSGMQFAQPYARGSSSAGLGLTGGTSYHAGAELIGDPDFAASARFEHSSSSYGTSDVIRLNAAGTLGAADKVLAAYDRSSAANQLLTTLPASVDASFGFALRDPSSDASNALVMYELRKNPGVLPTDLLTTSQVTQQNSLLADGNIVAQDATLSLEGIQSVSPRLELYAKLATRRELSAISAVSNIGTTLTFAQLRARYEIGRRYDVGAELRAVLQHSGNNYDELGYVGEFGYLLSPDLRAAIGYGGGRVDQALFSGQARNGVYLDFTLRVKNLWKH